jgi:hypothetical protein
LEFTEQIPQPMAADLVTLLGRVRDAWIFSGLRPAMTAVDSQQQAHFVRMLRLALFGIVAEMAVFAVGYIAPAMTTLLRPVYILIAALFVFALWRAAKRRPGHDRRHNAVGDRRHTDRRD